MSASDNPASRKLPKSIEAAIGQLVRVAWDSVGLQDRNVITATEALRAALRPSLLPAEITPEIAEVLGLPNFRCGPIADVFRSAGHTIEAKSEKEQAFVLFRFLHLALQQGPGWFAQSCIDLDAAVEVAKAKMDTKPGAPS